MLAQRWRGVLRNHESIRQRGTSKHQGQVRPKEKDSLSGHFPWNWCHKLRLDFFFLMEKKTRVGCVFSFMIYLF